MKRSAVTIDELQEGHVISLSVAPDGTYGWANYGWLVPATHRMVAATVTRVSQDPLHGLRIEMEADGRGLLVEHNPETLKHAAKVTAFGRTTFYIGLLDEHYDVCGGCGELSPCRARRLEAEVHQFEHELNDMCDHCGKKIGSAWKVIIGGNPPLRFHQAKKYRANGKRCVDVANAARAERAASQKDNAT